MKNQETIDYLRETQIVIENAMSAENLSISIINSMSGLVNEISNEIYELENES